MKKSFLCTWVSILGLTAIAHTSYAGSPSSQTPSGPPKTWSRGVALPISVAQRMEMYQGKNLVYIQGDSRGKAATPEQIDTLKTALSHTQQTPFFAMQRVLGIGEEMGLLMEIPANQRWWMLMSSGLNRLKLQLVKAPNLGSILLVTEFVDNGEKNPNRDSHLVNLWQGYVKLTPAFLQKLVQIFPEYKIQPKLGAGQ